MPETPGWGALGSSSHFLGVAPGPVEGRVWAQTLSQGDEGVTPPLAFD